MILDILTGAMALLGALFILLAGIGLVRMPDTYLRISVATKATTLGVGLSLIAFGLYFYQEMATMHVMIIILFIMLTAPVSAHLIGRATYISKNKLWKQSVSDDLKDQYTEEGEVKH